MAYLREIEFNKQEQTAFGELLTAHLTPVLQIANKYQIDPANLTDFMETFEATGGSVDNSANLFRCQTGTSVGGYGVIRTNDTLNYKAGQGVEALFTAKFTTGVANSLQFGGMFSLTETVAFGYNGTDFSALHSYGGAAEVQKIQVTVTGAGTCTVTLDSDAVGITVTSSTVQTNAEELRAGLVADSTLNSKWRFEQVDDSVFCISRSVGNKTGTMSVSGGVTATITEATAGVDKTDNHTSQGSFNISAPFSGFDPTQLNVYKIEFGYLGVANIRYSIYNPNTAKFEAVHQIEWANSNSITHITSPNLKVGWTAASLGSTTNLTVLGASASMFLQGDDVKSNDVHATRNTKTSISTTTTSVLTIKNRTVYGNRFNLGKVLPVRCSVAIEHNKNVIVSIYKNATLAGTPNYQYHDEYNSITIVDTAGTTTSGGELIDAFTVAAQGQKEIDLTPLIARILPEETLTIAAETVSGTSTNIVATLTWKEEK